jgi:hypothetical protein
MKKYLKEGWATREEIDSTRIKAYLSFEEEETLLDSTLGETWQYRNRLGKLIECKVLFRRENGEIVVENGKGGRVCLSQDDLVSAIYERIYDFCRVRNLGSVFKNGDEPTPRVKFIMELLDFEGIPYELDSFKVGEVTCHNIVLKGDSNKMVVAHHDIVNPDIDNANDNSASVINAIAIKKSLPQVRVVLLDGEEVGGLGSQRCSDQIKAGEFGEIEWVLNLELSGKGGKKFFVGNYPGKLQDLIVEKFDCPIVSTPFNDSVIFRKNGIDSVVINPLPLTEGGEDLDYSLLRNCHSSRDTIDTIDPAEMREFVEEVVIPLLLT